MTSVPITSWQIDGEKVEIVADFIILGSKIRADSDCSHRIKRCLLFGGKAMTNLGSTLKSRVITLPTKIHMVKTMIFPVVMYRCELDHKEGWALKNDAFELWCWKGLSKVRWITRRSNQSILKKFDPEYSLEGLMLSWSSSTLATSWEELTHWRRLWHWER